MRQYQLLEARTLLQIQHVQVFPFDTRTHAVDRSGSHFIPDFQIPAQNKNLPNLE
jgi:hypothetical protein